MESQALMVILVPLLGSLLIPLAGWAGLRKATGPMAVLLIGCAHVLTWPLLGPALAGRTGESSIPLYRWIEFSTNIDALAVFMAFTASLIATLIAVYSLGYIEHTEHEPEYYFIVTLFVGAMMGLVFSRNLIFLYMFWEISALACWRLIGYFRDPEYVWKADKAFLITFGGAVFMLLGFALIFTQYGTFDISELRGKEIGTAALVLVMAGIFSKSATVPLHTWLPDAGVAPSTITSLLHAAILVKIGLYAFARLFCNGMVIAPEAQTWLLVLALLSAFVSAAAALHETNIKRLLAYSTVSQIGYTFLGLMVFTHFGYIGALLYIMAHGFAKGGLFLCAGIIEHGTHTKDMTKMGGLFRKMPVTGVSYLICALSIAGIPPMAGFFSKYFVINGLVEGGRIAIATLAILTAVVTLLYMLKSFRMVFLGESRGEAHGEGSPVMVGVVAVLAVLTVASGFLLQLPYDLVKVADGQRLVELVSLLWR
ncbi:MAG: NADH-quinone oxidoreductase subunit L [Acidobacteria bacterium]|jgi:NADH:ubiquinone oxidoreductase subunit 5 (subunit L)/multisubunit Na+/H+ antiporter MnhA subunit|nr:NADH-quinone oxidoreductase subunit L [Acidobacteriota bacterium]